MEFRYWDKWTLSFPLPFPHPFPHALSCLPGWLSPFRSHNLWQGSKGQPMMTILALVNLWLFICLAVLGLKLQYLGSSVFIVACKIFSCGMWDLVPWPGIEPRPPALGAQSLSHWTTMSLNKIFLNLFPYHLGTLSSETKMWIFSGWIQKL